MTGHPPDPLAQLEAPPAFVVGMHRSGTTWAYDLLTAHPKVAGIFESGFFSADLGVAPLFHRTHWYGDEATLEADRRLFGLSFRLNQLLSREEALEDVRALASAWLGRALGPSHRFLVEKTPQHLYTMHLIDELFPGAAFVHLIRDGRDVAVSLEAAGRSWARGRVREANRRTAAHRWAAAIARARHLATEHGLRYTEVRYEDLRARVPGTLESLFEFCRIPAEPGDIEQAWDAAALERRRSGESDPFRRRGTSEWRQRFRLLDRLRFDRAAGALLVELGYESSRRWWLAPGRSETSG
jgi:hypothetical protein